jgi:hypothetical protein
MTSTLYRHVNSQNDSDLLQKDLSALEKWEEEWQMSFHPQKCTVIRRATKSENKKIAGLRSIRSIQVY